MEENGVVVALGGYRGASFAVRAGGRGDVTATHRLWHKPKDIGWLGTGVVHDGALYICDTGGVIYCIDVASWGSFCGRAAAGAEGPGLASRRPLTERCTY